MSIMADTKIQIQKVCTWQVTAPYMKHPYVFKDSEVQWVSMPSEVDGCSEMCMFVRLAKGSNAAQRLMFGKSRGAKGSARMANTTIIEKLKKLRDETRNKAIEQLLEAEKAAKQMELATQLEGRIDISFDAEVVKEKKPKPALKVMPNKFVKFMTPTIQDIEGGEIAAIIEPEIKKKNPKVLYIKLTDVAIKYLHDVSKYEATQGVHCKHARSRHDSVGIAGLSRIYKGRYQGQYKLKRRGMRQIIFHADGDDDAAEKVDAIVNRCNASRSHVGQIDSRTPVNRSRSSENDGSNASEEAVTDTE